MPVSLLVHAVTHCLRTLSSVAFDLAKFASLSVRSHKSLAAENLFLRKQLALFQERKVKPRRANDATRWLMATLGRMFQWQCAGECQAGYAHPLATQRTPALLALEVEAVGTTTPATESSGVDPTNGS
jgi:hypothetical protein